MTGEEFRAAREALGLTQSEMAEAVGLGSYKRISEMESGRARVTRRIEIVVGLLLERQEKKEPNSPSTRPASSARAGRGRARR